MKSAPDEGSFLIDRPFTESYVGDATLDQVKTALAANDWPSDTPLAWMLEWWTYCLAKDEAEYPEFDWNGFRQSLFRYNVRDRRDIVRFMSGHMDRLQLPQSN